MASLRPSASFASTFSWQMSNCASFATIALAASRTGTETWSSVSVSARSMRGLSAAAERSVVAFSRSASSSTFAITRLAGGSSSGATWEPSFSASATASFSVSPSSSLTPSMSARSMRRCSSIASASSTKRAGNSPSMPFASFTSSSRSRTGCRSMVDFSISSSLMALSRSRSSTASSSSDVIGIARQASYAAQPFLSSSSTGLYFFSSGRCLRPTKGSSAPSLGGIAVISARTMSTAPFHIAMGVCLVLDCAMFHTRFTTSVALATIASSSGVRREPKSPSRQRWPSTSHAQVRACSTGMCCRASLYVPLDLCAAATMLSASPFLSTLRRAVRAGSVRSSGALMQSPGTTRTFSWKYGSKS
mmetsp:Transcript_12413/g.43046  ORF Transcript_12413/g.43046 Transcript_12413/m.43046 type:complete len:362 (+) Transcript_12413:176-1261(+)